MFTFQEIIHTPAMRSKGNVLQYKINQNPLSQKMIYAKKVRGEWTNHKKTYATQTQQVANPNTGSLLRLNGTLTSVGGVATSPNTYCIYDPASFPVNQPAEIVEIPPYVYATPPIDEVTPPEPAGPITAPLFVPPAVPPEEPVNYVAPTGGILVCSVTVVPTCNVAAAEQPVVTETTDQMCYTADYSDVPGNSVLCWDEGTQTWFPHPLGVSE